jgi:hypothetical protein
VQSPGGLAERVARQQPLKQRALGAAKIRVVGWLFADLVVERSQPAQVLAEHVDDFTRCRGGHDEVGAGHGSQHCLLGRVYVGYLARADLAGACAGEAPGHREPGGG